MNLRVLLIAGCAVCALAGAVGSELELAKSTAAASVPEAPATVSATDLHWQRVVMIGASATAGFTMTDFRGSKQYALSGYIDRALRVPHGPIRNFASTMFFTQPEANGRNQVNQALREQPSAVLGVDFLFWFCYGDGATDEARLQRFEYGLKLLDEFKCPLLVGDIPDASAAAPGMLQTSQVPSATAQKLANRRLKEWAAERKHVVVVSLSGFMRAATANEALTFRGETLPAGTTRALLQLDLLHPSRHGAALLSLVMIDALQAAQPKRFAGEVSWDVAELLREPPAATTETNLPPSIAPAGLPAPKP